ncbi:MAG: replicative DNA helicase [Firmicutes bacterium]|nr:replicative DNA helicase [Bacillota bacterium]
MVELSDRLPPQNLEAEKSVLGSMIIEEEAILTAAEILKPEDFYREANRELFATMVALADRGEPVDVITLAEDLSRRQKLESVGGPTYLTALANVVPTAANVAYYARIVREKALLRRLINAATKIAAKSYEPPENVDELIDEAEQLIFDVANRRDQQGFTPLKEILPRTFENIEKLYENKSGITGKATGFVDFDNLTSGLQDSDLIIIAARPSMGKTTLALNMAHYLAVREKEPVAFFSLEMSKEQLVQRLLCAEAGIDSQRLRRGMLTDDDWPKLTRAVGPLSEAKLFIDDTAAISIVEMRAKARRLKAEHGLSAVFVDYLQLMTSSTKHENRQQEISSISRSLKALAKELSVPVVALSQLSRAVEQRNDKRPILSDLLESGGIEANADLVAFIYRDDYYNKESEKENIAEIIIAKQRNGPVGTIELYFMSSQNKFLNLSYKEQDLAIG